MKKIKFNLKLTAFLVSLFVALLLIILGGKNNVCLSFGFMALGASLAIFALYLKEKTSKAITEIDEQIADISMEEETDEVSKDYMILELANEEKRIKKKSKKTWLLFTLTGAVIALIGLINLFIK